MAKPPGFGHIIFARGETAAGNIVKRLNVADNNRRQANITEAHSERGLSCGPLRNFRCCSVRLSNRTSAKEETTHSLNNSSACCWQHCCSGPAAVPPLRRRQRRKRSRQMPGWTRSFRVMPSSRRKSREPVEDLTVPDQTAAVGGANFALGLLRGAAKPDATTILSPYSALLALGMAANGAGGRRWRRWNMPGAG